MTIMIMVMMLNIHVYFYQDLPQSFYLFPQISFQQDNGKMSSKVKLRVTVHWDLKTVAATNPAHHGISTLVIFG